MERTKAAERNWGGNVTYRAPRLHRPRDVEELRAVVRGAARVKALGTRHSFNGVADTEGDLVSLDRFDRVLALDPAARTVTVDGGARYGDLGPWLHARGFALHTLASLPHIGVAGAVATGTHGSGDASPGLASAVLALEFVTADGEIARVSRAQDGARFDGLVVSLGALGVVTRLTLAVEPTYDVRQDVYEHLAFDRVAQDLRHVTGAAHSVSLFTDWRGHVFHQVWLKRRVDGPDMPDAPDEWLGAVRATRDLHPLPGMPAGNCTPQRGQPGPWFARLPHFRLEFTPSRGEEIQSEYFVPREHAAQALSAMFGLGDRLAPHLLVSEVRTVAADTAWLSPTGGRDSVALHFTWRPDEPAVRDALVEVEAVLAPFAARPHWGKVFLTSPERLAELYPRLPDFRRLVGEFDPSGKFRNAFLDVGVFGMGGWGASR